MKRRLSPQLQFDAPVKWKAIPNGCAVRLTAGAREPRNAEGTIRVCRVEVKLFLPKQHWRHVLPQPQQRFQAKWPPVRVKETRKTKTWSPDPISDRKGSSVNALAFALRRDRDGGSSRSGNNPRGELSPPRAAARRPAPICREHGRPARRRPTLRRTAMRLYRQSKLLFFQVVGKSQTCFAPGLARGLMSRSA